MSEEENSPELPETEATFITHLLELRDRLLRTVIFLAVLFAVIFPFANNLYSFLADPLLAHLPEGSTMIAVEVITPFLTPLKMALFAAIFMGMPYLLYQAWSFVAPGLYHHEKRLAVPLLFSSIFLFYAGVSFAYFVVFPLVFGFLVSVAPEGVAMMTDISKYLDFILAMFFAFGLAFEVPVATIILIAMGVTTADSMVEKRPYIIVGAFVLGMLLTPPDVISQLMLAFPMWLLFEGGIIMSRILIKPRDDDEEEVDSDESIISYNDVRPEPAAATATASTAAEATPPTGYSTAAYPDDYEPLTEEELDAALDEETASWDDDEEEESGNTDEEPSEPESQGDDEDATAPQEAEDDARESDPDWEDGDDDEEGWDDDDDEETPEVGSEDRDKT